MIVEIIFDPSQITTTQAVVVGSFALVGALLTTGAVVETCVKVTKKIFTRSTVKTN